MSSGAHVDPSNKKIALQIAILAVVLAFSETLGKGAQTAALSYNIEASNLWSFFQAKTIRQTIMRTEAEGLEAQSGAQLSDRATEAVKMQIDTWKKTAERYQSEPRDQRGTQGARRPREKSGRKARPVACFVPSLRSGLSRGADRDRARLRRGDHQRDRARMGFCGIGCRSSWVLLDRLFLADGGAPVLGHANS